MVRFFGAQGNLPATARDVVAGTGANPACVKRELCRNDRFVRAGYYRGLMLWKLSPGGLETAAKEVTHEQRDSPG
jgi:hypothetical protein